MRIGTGYDVHRFGPGDHVKIGGVSISHSKGVVANSDGDVLLHALMDALLGAAAAGDIGRHFPPGDARFAGADSRALLRQVMKIVAGRGYAVVNCDLTVVAESPRIGTHCDAICANIAADLGIAPGCVNVKATTAEGLGALGRAEGIAAQAVVLLREGHGPLSRPRPMPGLPSQSQPPGPSANRRQQARCEWTPPTSRSRSASASTPTAAKHIAWSWSRSGTRTPCLSPASSPRTLRSPRRKSDSPA